jgi:hypothetical protein
MMGLAETGEDSHGPDGYYPKAKTIGLVIKTSRCR